jgi:hypothetical protein
MAWAAAACPLWKRACARNGAARKRESAYACCAGALSAAILPWGASAVDSRKNSAPDTFAGAFSLECRCSAALLPEGCHEEG